MSRTGTNRRAMRFEAIPAMMSMIPSVVRGVSLEDLERIKRIVRATFPSVSQAGSATVSEWMKKERARTLLLVDVRSAAEYTVSHLDGAVNLRRLPEIRRAIIERQPSRTVVYCSVGFRSSRIAAQLADDVNEIYNLEGSIFEWANQGRPLFQGRDQAVTVHPFGKRWAGLLRFGLASKLK